MARLAVAAVVALSLVTAACGGGQAASSASGSSASGSSASGSSASGSQAGATSASITIKDFAFSPKELKVKAGTPIEVRNDDTQAHTLTSDTPGQFDTDAVMAGTSAKKTITLQQKGTYAFHCSFHPFMTGTIVVE